MIGEPGCAKPLSSPEFLHKEKTVVKTTDCEKVRKPGDPVESDYVNRFCISTAFPDCGKPLWKNLWRMWKTISFQQVFRCLGPYPQAVEKSVYRFA
jgi:hypothetical protein